MTDFGNAWRKHRKHACGVIRAVFVLIFAFAAFGAPHPAQAQRPPISPTLYAAFDQCWDAVVFAKLEPLADFEHKYEELKAGKIKIWYAKVETDLGSLELSAHFRDNFLYECTMTSSPTGEFADPVAYWDSYETINAWHASVLGAPGCHDTKIADGFFSLVCCVKDWNAMVLSATSWELLDDFSVYKTSAEPVPGDLRFSVFASSPRNFPECSKDQ